VAVAMDRALPSRVVPYHVNIETSSQHTTLDLSREALEQGVLIPWRTGGPIVLGNETFDLKDIESLRIYFTEEESASFRDAVKERLTQEEKTFYYSDTWSGPDDRAVDWQIASHGQDVTDELSTASPGSASDAAGSGSSSPGDFSG
jgi:hypothetical protein